MSSKGRRAFELRLDLESGVPVYRQIIDQVLAGVASGLLTEGVQLPTVRQVAVELEINPNTVVRAYDILLMEGLVESRPASGIYVAEALPGLPGRIVLVSNEVGLGIVPDNALARDFRDRAGWLHQEIAAVAERVYWIAAGLPQLRILRAERVRRTVERDGGQATAVDTLVRAERPAG